MLVCWLSSKVLEKAWREHFRNFQEFKELQRLLYIKMMRDIKHLITQPAGNSENFTNIYENPELMSRIFRNIEKKLRSSTILKEFQEDQRSFRSLIVRAQVLFCVTKGFLILLLHILKDFGKNKMTDVFIKW
jgi:hypothetical protein